MQDIKWEQAFLPAPRTLEARIEDAFERGEIEMNKRRKIISLLAAAAVLAVVFAVAGFAMTELYRPVPDNVVLSRGSGEGETAEEALPVSVDGGAELIPEEKETAQADSEPDFMHVDPAQEDALETLLDMAYRDFCEINALEIDSRAVYAAASELETLPESIGSQTEAWIAPMIDILKAQLGLTDEYIEENLLTNYVTACLFVQNEKQETAGGNTDAAEGSRLFPAAEEAM